MDYPCIVFSQRQEEEAPRFCVFRAPVGEVISWTTIPRLSPEDTEGIQRARNNFKVRAIRKFLVDDKRNTIPTAIVLTFTPGSYTLSPVDGQADFQKLTIDPENRDGVFVVDGQHRLYGLNEFNPESEVPVVAILDSTNEEKAFQFIVINNKVSKVAPDHIRALSLNFTDSDGNEGLEGRLKTARLSLSRNISYVGAANESDESPFRGIVALPAVPEENQIVVPAAIESSIAYIQSKKLRQLVDEDSEYEFFISMWSTIKEAWSSAFSKTSKLLSKVGVLSMTKYVVDTVDFMASFSDHDFNLSNSDDVTKAVKRVLALQDEQFWLADWSISISDTKSVRDEIDETLKNIQQNMRYKQPWYTDLKIIKSGQAGADEDQAS
ncbi:DGQHR domain-containing protein [Burkholderia sp. BCC1999]|uniref:DGQHR domain-containing protein n=1 Tax=Burkholderia sp. BCC1999 TaxID=2817448 RepID=UPI002AC310CC|nr:DGQHR domain-containing protein [Burkholderia sp. BCC1999]